MKIVEFVKANLSSWTVRLGALAAFLVTVSHYMPQVQEIVHVIWPVADEWLVVAAMWIGRSIGFIRNIIAAANSLEGK